jgi:hypothetical protein
MAGDPDHLVLVFLRRLDEKVDRVGDDVRDLKVRMPALVDAVVGMRRRMDRLDLRLGRFEKRLGLAEMTR